MQRRSLTAIAILATLALFLAGCAPELPREWREALYGPDATPTPRLRNAPTPVPTMAIGLPTPPPNATPLPTLTLVPTRTRTVTRTATATPASATLTLQQGALWYTNGHFAPYEGVEDTYISAWSRTGNFADAPVLSVRQGDVMATLIYIHLGDLPQSLPIYKAELSVYVQTRSNDTPMTISLRSVLAPWLLKDATWLHGTQSLLWQKPGAGGESDRQDKPVAEVLADGRAEWLTFTITDLVQQWLRDPQANQGVLLTGEAASAVQYDITSADARDERHRPRLTLTFPTGAIALSPPRVATATATPVATVDANRPELVNVARLLPLGATLLARAIGDLDNAGALDIVAAYQPAATRAIRVAVLAYPGQSAGGADYRLSWSSLDVSGGAPAGLDIVDITGDGVAEILLSATNPVGGGKMLYVFVRRPAGYRLASAVGGYFDGKDSFGEAGFDLADTNGDGRVEIRAYYAGKADIYAWDGLNFTVVP